MADKSYRVVLCSSAEDLDATTNLLIAANHRVQLAFGGQRCEIDTVLLQRVSLVCDGEASEGKAGGK